MSNLTLQEKIEAIHAEGMAYSAIARRAGCDTSTLFRIRQGDIVDPKYSVGIAIDGLYSRMAAPTAAVSVGQPQALPTAVA